MQTILSFNTVFKNMFKMPSNTLDFSVVLKYSQYSAVFPTKDKYQNAYNILTGGLLLQDVINFQTHDIQQKKQVCYGSNQLYGGVNLCIIITT